MGFYDHKLMYEFHAKDLVQTEALKQLADHAVKEIKSIGGWDTEIHVNVEPEVRDKRIFSVSMAIFGLREPVVVKKQGKQVLAVLKKVRKAALRQIRRMNEKRIAMRKKQFLKEQFAS